MERSSASDGYGGGGGAAVLLSNAFKDKEDTVVAVVDGLLLLKSVGASGIGNRGDLGSRPE
jgi:hypothetical protein